MKKLGLVIVSVALAVSVFTGCSNKKASSNSISIMFQGSDLEQSALKGCAERFTAETGINVELLYTPHDSYTSKLASFIKNKNVPDIISIDGPVLANLAWSGVIQCVEPYISQDIIDDMTPSNVEQCTYPVDKKLYAISYADSTVLLYCNKTYLNKIGARIPKSVDDSWTAAEFDDILTKLAALPEVKWPLDLMWAWNIAGSEWGTYAFYECLASGGGDIINRNTWVADGTLNSEASVNVLKYFQKWGTNGWIVPKSAGENTLYNDKRQTAIAWNGNWNYLTCEASMGDEVVVVPLPNFGKGTRTPNATWIWGISATSKNPDKAGKFLNYMMTDTTFLDIQETNACYPALKKFAERCEVYMDPAKMGIAYEQSNYAISRPNHPAYPTITLAFSDAFEAILNGADIKIELDKAAQKIDEDIKDNNGYPPFGKN
ncbi:extracellular solute-binding protein [Treponema sp. Marseille-Q3903]|uniref:sugar ABC transporter substrate-binding protein n=1 Tax=Treponema sp. Marseille-Q3903 TaxID=2766703 RepID=UPI001651F32F|nr:extracellular solute-binding protein [Treponema sp. Marseille-Q3903]MBC6712738.1 extracellular solute-binding protein [Treponema sp. Marseille-Q3903]